jgi:hypothetical protein
LGLLAIFNRRWTRGLVNVVALLTLLGLAAFLHPFDGELGTYSGEAKGYVQDKTVWVPCNFRAHFEGSGIMLKGAQVHGYQENWNLSMEQLAERYPMFAVRLPLQTKPCVGCAVIGQRLEIRSRHSSEELRAMLGGEVYQHLFEREWLLESPKSVGAATSTGSGQAFTLTGTRAANSNHQQVDSYNKQANLQEEGCR